LTAERFIDNPFATPSDIEKGYTRLYKTGDRVRWLPDGNLEYLGRLDNQVKIRGFRIELGEIESALGQLDSVKQAVVIDREHNGHKTLIAYVVADNAQNEQTSGCDLDTDALLAQLASQLPDYMVPATLTVIDAVPLTINGKLDRRALPEPTWVNGDNYAAPRNETEAQLCAIWQEVLGIEQVGIHDNFFRIGGNSISAIRLTAHSRQLMDCDIPLALLFEQKTIAGLAAHMVMDAAVLIPARDQTRSPLSFAQERLLFIERYEGGSDVYHMPHLVKLDAAADLSTLEAAFNALIARHQVLGSHFITVDGQDYQQAGSQPLQIVSQACQDQAQLINVLRTAIAQPFDLFAEAPIRVQHYTVGDAQYVLILLHHIAADGWSMDIFLKELSIIYAALLQDESPQLPALSIQYADYACWQREHLQGETYTQLLDYWQQSLNGVETLQLPTDHPRPSTMDYRGKDVNFTVDARLSEQLRALAREQETTLYTVLLSGFYITLSALSGQDDIVIGTPSENRAHSQTQSLIGFFVSSLALRTTLTPEESITALIQRVHDTVMGAKVHQAMPFEKLVDALQVERDTARHPLFQVMFGVQHAEANTDDDDSALPFSPTTLDEQDSLYSPAKFDLSLFLDDGKASIEGQWNYAIGLFD
ncbi:hypothetical protein LCGC14_2155100, partial [marine sediment metagenome]